MSNLEPHQERMLAEHAELKDKVLKLNNFTTSTAFRQLESEEQDLLHQQCDAMSDYLAVLQVRIRRFTGVKNYTCHKKVLARPMTRGAYNELQGWTIPAGENPDDEGFLIEYLDGGTPNHKDFEHYISWSPKDVFLAGYKESK